MIGQEIRSIPGRAKATGLRSRAKRDLTMRKVKKAVSEIVDEDLARSEIDETYICNSPSPSPSPSPLTMPIETKYHLMVVFTYLHTYHCRSYLDDTHHD